MPFDAAPPRTLADVIAAIEINPALNDVQRRDYVFAIKRISVALGAQPASWPADLQRLRPMINSLRAHREGIAAKTLANWRSNFLKAVNHYGLAKQQRVPLTPEWSALRGLVTDRATSAGLSRFMQFCSVRGIVPEDVGDDAVAAFVESLKETLVRKPNQVHRRTCQLWRDAARTVPGWPQQELTLSDYRKPRTSLPLTAFPESFSQDVEAYLRARSQPPDLGEDDTLRQWKPGTVKQCRTDLGLAASALVHRGVPIQTITDLKTLVQPANVREILRHYFEKETPKKKAQTWTTFTRGLHRCLSTVAAHWVKAPSEDLSELRNMRRKLGREPVGMIDKNLDMLRQFYELENRHRLYGLPSKLAAIARTRAAAGLPIERLSSCRWRPPSRSCCMRQSG